MLASEPRSFVLFKPKVKLKADKHEVLCELEPSIGKNVGFNEGYYLQDKSRVYTVCLVLEIVNLSRSRVSIWI